MSHDLIGGRSLQLAQETRFDRQLRAFGNAAQERLRAVRVCVVGVGGIGSHIVQALAYLGVGTFLLVDEDRVEYSNLNRLVSATAADVGRAKVDAAADLIRGIDPDATCHSISKTLRSQEALLAATNASFVFGCVDNDSARLVLMELCCAYKIPYLDAATEFFVQDGAVQDFGGRVVVNVPGDFCLDCAGEIDMEAAKAGLEPENVRKVREQHGYGFGPSQPSPAVVSLNGIVANIAVTEFLMMVSEIRKPFRKATYKGMRGILQVSRDVRRTGCFNCEYLLGKREAANIFRYALTA